MVNHSVWEACEETEHSKERKGQIPDHLGVGQPWRQGSSIWTEEGVMTYKRQSGCVKPCWPQRGVQLLLGHQGETLQRCEQGRMMRVQSDLQRNPLAAVLTTRLGVKSGEQGN